MYTCEKIVKNKSARTIFISSTLKNLKPHRKNLRALFSKPLTPLGLKFTPIFSEIPESLPHTGADLNNSKKQNPNLLILDKVAYSDYFLILIDENYYGSPNIFDEDYLDVISITHAEFRTAYKKALPIFLCITRKFYKQYRLFRLLTLNWHLCWKAGETWNAYKFFHEILKKEMQINITICPYTSASDLNDSVSEALKSYDRSSYIESTCDKGIYSSQEEFEIEWVIENTGCTIWKERYFIETKPRIHIFFREVFKIYTRKVSDTNFAKKTVITLRKIFEFFQAYFSSSTAEHRIYAIPTTHPGEQVRLAVKYKAPLKAGKIISTWKMVNAQKQLLFPKLLPLTLEYKCIGKRT